MLRESHLINQFPAFPRHTADRGKIERSEKVDFERRVEGTRR